MYFGVMRSATQDPDLFGKSAADSAKDRDRKSSGRIEYTRRDLRYV